MRWLLKFLLSLLKEFGMGIPANITNDLQLVSDDLDAQNATGVAKAATTAALVQAQSDAAALVAKAQSDAATMVSKAQSDDNAAADADNAARLKTGTDQQTLLNDIAAWIAGGPPQADVKKVFQTWAGHLKKVK